MSDFLAVEKEMDIRVTGVVLLLFGVGILAGSLAAGLVVDKMWARHKRLIPLLLLATTVAGAVPMVFYVEAPPLGFGATALFVIPAGFGLGFAGNSTKTIIANVTVPEARGSAFALLTLFDDLGKGVGVFLLSKMFLLFEATPERSARQQGIAVAFAVGWPLCGITCGLIYFFIERDYARAQADVAGAIAALPAPAKAELAPAKAELAPA
jgi:predicted MFS family arabinose efflux permease